MVITKGFLLTGLSLLSTLGYAQPWTVQTAAFRDSGKVETRVAELRALGFDAYSEFAMLGGKRYARVRVGCAFERAGAAALAQSLRVVTWEAAVVPLGPDAGAGACVDFDLGFRLPERWGVSQRSPEAIRFWVEVGGRRGGVVYHGAWQVLQNESDSLPERLPRTGLQNNLLQNSAAQGSASDASTPSEARFAAGPNGDITVATPSGRFVVGRGELLWSVGGVGVARIGDEVVAIRLLRVPLPKTP